MSKISSAEKSQWALVYQDYIAVILKAFEQHLFRLQYSLTLQHDADVILKLQILIFAENTKPFRHATRSGKLQKAASISEAIKQLQNSETQTEILVFRVIVPF